jgi:RNA polymerase sigma factor (sigma-70 family)
MDRDDHATVRTVLSGDKEAYGRLVALHSRALFRVAYRITGNEADADEVVQDAFLRGYRKLETFEARAHFGSWIYRIAVRCALDRVAARRGKALGSAAEMDADRETVQIADGAPDPERLALSGEMGAVRESAMQGLTAEERTAFTLRHMEGCSLEEIASALDIAPKRGQTGSVSRGAETEAAPGAVEGEGMKHLSEEELVERYYGEGGAEAALHLERCGECAAAYGALQADLAEVGTMEAPTRGEAYGEEVWRSLAGSLGAYPGQRRRRGSRLAGSRAAWWVALGAAAACALLAAFHAGRLWEHRQIQPVIAHAPAAPKPQVVVVVLSDRLDRSERLLVELKHTDADDAAVMPALRDEARTLLAANGSWRQDAAKTGDPAMTKALDRLNQLLVELANQPDGFNAAAIAKLQEEMKADGLLFELRVLRSRLNDGHAQGKGQLQDRLKGGTA